MLRRKWAVGTAFVRGSSGVVVCSISLCFSHPGFRASSACVASARGTLVSSPYPTSNHAGKGDFACVLPAVWAVDTVLLIARYSEEDAEGAGLEGDVAAARMP
jgi:hypothetical protein